jgi:hypothetical protein
VNQLSGLEAERRAIHQLAINQNVTVDNHLACLRGGASDSRTHDERIKTHFEEFDQVLTGQARSAAGFLEDALELCLTNTVLGAQTLLLAKTNGVVRVCLSLGAPMLTRSIGTLLKVLGGLGREGDSQRTRQAGLTAGT